MKALAVAGAELWASFGYTTVQEGALHARHGKAHEGSGR